ncbi:biotin--[acetyl-CoA-carboxylase] ligase [Lactobacillus panisapium]|uniref:biotin--[acetyl-CoA-carboxylase] ligase n=1 Tax=Lactobacillus panisapium TaxID=2012495 RepID=UPI001C69A6EC|nr:biotin--[acetyl-CoA-carboxylase] ligase [Lactobacillus panisapium]QYN59199.1 biotin--[acetyl-CoA-carboxylase] ligase [Lactobacillus panisapium]
MCNEQTSTAVKKESLKMLLADLPLQINWWQTCKSTNLAAKEDFLANGYDGPKLFGSDVQTGGYGKNARPFISNQGGIYLSLVIKVPQLTGQNQGLLTTGIAWQLYETIKQELQIETELKWVNDLFWQGKKIAGILVECPAPHVAIIGIGCNLFQTHLSEELPGATNLLTVQPTTAKTCHLISNLVHHLFSFIPNFIHSDFLPQYKKHMMLLNKKVTLQLGQTTIQGRAVDLTPMGNLVLETETGSRSFNAGEITRIR